MGEQLHGDQSAVCGRCTHWIRDKTSTIIDGYVPTLKGSCLITGGACGQEYSCYEFAERTWRYYEEQKRQ